MEENINRPLAGAAEPQAEGVSINALMRHIRQRWYWYVVSCVLTLGLAVLYICKATPMYTASTEILLKDDSSQSVVGDLSMLGVAPVQSDILNEMFIMTSPAVMEEVVSRLNLNEVYTTPYRIRRRELYNVSPVLAEADSVGHRAVSVRFRMDINEDASGVTISNFYVKGKKVSADPVEAPFNTPVETPVGIYTIYATKYLHEQVSPDREIPDRVYYSYTPVDACARNYLTRLNSKFDDNRGNIVTLSIDCTSLRKAYDVLSEIVDVYNDRWVSDRNKIAVATSSFIEDRLKSLEAELGDVETNITEFKSANRMLDLDAVANLYLQQSADNQKALTSLAQDIAIAKYVKSELAANDITRLLPATAEIGGTDVSDMVREYNKAVSERNIKMLTLPAESPLMRQKADQISQMREAILASVNAALESLNARYNSLRMVDNSTQERLTNAPAKAKYLMSEERKQKVKETLYIYLLQRREENELSQAFTAYNTRMVTEPYGLDSPTSPRKGIILLLALILGLAIPTAIIYLSELMDTKVRSRRDIEDMPFPFLGEVPRVNVDEPAGQLGRLALFRVKRNASDREVRPLVVRKHCGNSVNEAFRMLRSNIDFIDATREKTTDNGNRVIMVVSLNPGSGKTFISLNTAAIFALKGRKVCLVDLDLRKGTVSRNVGNPRTGLVDFLIGKTDDLSSLIVRNVGDIDGFDLLPEGLRPPNPTELLYNGRLKLMMDRLREMYDYVIIDCPPVEVVADALVINPYVDMTLFVMRAGRFERSDLPVLYSFYHNQRYNNLAVVLNDTDSIHGAYGHYGYSYGYSTKK